jgi:hypothetical protein
MADEAGQAVDRIRSPTPESIEEKESKKTAHA